MQRFVDASDIELHSQRFRWGLLVTLYCVWLSYNISSVNVSLKVLSSASGCFTTNAKNDINRV